MSLTAHYKQFFIFLITSLWLIRDQKASFLSVAPSVLTNCKSDQ